MTTTQDTRISVHLVEDHPATRDGLKMAINLQADMRVCGESGSCTRALDALSTVRPDVLVLDLNLPDGNGWTLIELLSQKGILPPTLVLSVCDESLYARRLLRSGARGYLMKNETTDNILDAIRSISRGKLVASDDITNQLMAEALDMDGSSGEASSSESRPSALTDREMQVFALLANGMGNKEIAAHFGLSEKTVSTHKINLMKKLGVRNPLKLAEAYRNHLSPSH